MTRLRTPRRSRRRRKRRSSADLLTEFDSRARPHVEALLETDEDLRGLVAANQHSMFKGRLVALAVTDRRLLVVPLDRKIEPKGAPISIAPEQIADAKAGGAGGGWAEAGAAIMDKAAAELRLRTIDGQKLKLLMMRGTGPGPLGDLGGGEPQQQGIEALATWFSGLTERRPGN
jgi:hypothetical protein